jgi:hypothetical protein
MDRLFIGALAAAAMLTGCGGNSAAPGGSLPIFNANAESTRPHASVHRSWMSREAAKDNLLYVSDIGTNDVYVLSYPKGKVVGTLTGFNSPAGECVDATGDIFIANSNASQILEYAHGGTAPIATLDDSGYYPSGCSIDPTTGNLAVTNTTTTGSRAGSVAVYTGAQGTPSNSQIGNFYYYFFCGYDKAGDLFVDGLNINFQFEFAWLPKNGYGFEHISLSQSIEWPGAVQWDGKYLALTDANAGVVYQIQMTSSGAQIAGSTSLTGAAPMYQSWIPPLHGKNRQGTHVVGARSVHNGNLMIWAYPAGGSPTKTISGFTQPYGSVVSPGGS